MQPLAAIDLEPWGAVYVELAKVASSSLRIVFASLLGLDLEAVEGNPHALDFPDPGPRQRDADRLFPNRYAFAFVRDPWDRLVSCYRDKIAGEVRDFTGLADNGVAYCLAGFDVFTADMSFEAFVDAVAEIDDEQADEHFRSQHWAVTNAAGEIAIDFVGHYEDLAAGLARVSQATGLPIPAQLPRVQANPNPRPYGPMYSARTRDVVARRFARDIELFGYGFADSR